MVYCKQLQTFAEHFWKRFALCENEATRYVFLNRGWCERPCCHLHAHDSGTGRGHVSMCTDWCYPFYCGRWPFCFLFFCFCLFFCFVVLLMEYFLILFWRCVWFPYLFWKCYSGCRVCQCVWEKMLMYSDTCVIWICVRIHAETIDVRCQYVKKKAIDVCCQCVTPPPPPNKKQKKTTPTPLQFFVV